MRQPMAVVLFGIALALGPAAYAGDMMVSDAWIREAPPNATVMAGYFTLMNHGSQATTLKGVESDTFERVEIHQTTLQDGMMRMAAVDALAVAAGATVTLKPGGYHLMLIDPSRKLRQGDTVSLQLEFDNGETLKVAVPVEKADAEAGHGDGHDHH